MDKIFSENVSQIRNIDKDRIFYRNIMCGLMNRIEQISVLAGDKFPLFSPGKTDAWVISNSGSWMAGFWCGLQCMLVKYHLISRRKITTEDNVLNTVSRLESLLRIDSVHTAMVFWYGAGEDHWNRYSALSSLAQCAAEFHASRFDEQLGFMPLGKDFAAGPIGATTFSADSLSALIKILVYSNDPYLDSIARQHVDFYIAHCINTDGSCYPSWSNDANQHEIAGDWSRGQAWAIYGLVTAAACWADEIYTTTAERVLDYWLLSRGTSLAPNLLANPDGVLDPSASVIVALAMYEFSQENNQKYAQWAVKATQILDEVLMSPFLNVIPGVTSAIAYRFCGCAITTKAGGVAMTETVWGYYLLCSALQYRQKQLFGNIDQQFDCEFFHEEGVIDGSFQEEHF